MEDNISSSSGSKSNKFILIVGLTLLVAASILALMSGFAIGRTSVDTESNSITPEEAVVEIQEVTREVVVVVTATPQLLATAVDQVSPPDTPVLIETSVPNSDQSVPSDPVEEGEIDFSVFNEVWSLIDGEFDGELPRNDNRLYGAIAGSLETLDDQYTRFISPDVAARMRQDLNGSVSGIGAFVRENEEGLIEITRPIDGQPADLVGLLSGDVIIAVDGESVVDLGFDEVLLMVRGPEGTSVTITVARDDEIEPLEFTIIRTIFEVPVVISEMYESDGKQIAYVRLTSFTRNADQSLQDALNTLLSDDPDGLIFDLRDNGGGFLDQAVNVADMFLPQGVILYERNNQGDIDKTFESEDDDIAEEIPLVVLVNSGSASASEIVAGAIQDYDRGTLIGETTFGKGSVQLVHTLSDGSELRVTIARWFTPNNRSIGEEGIEPDIEEATPQDLGGDDDNQLQRAIEYLSGGE